MIAVAPLFLLQNKAFAQQAALMFDEILLWPLDPTGMGENERQQFDREVEWLIEQGVAKMVRMQFPAPMAMFMLRVEPRIVPKQGGTYDVDGLAAVNLVNRSWPNQNEPAIIVRGAALYLREVRGIDAVGLTAQGFTPDNHGQAVVEVTLCELPIPAEDTAWQDIVEFRQDAEAQRTHKALKVWMHDIATTTVSASEVRDHLQHLLAQYEHYMKIHSIKARRGTLQTIIVAGAGMVENLAKFKLKDLAESLFRVGEGKIKLAEAELAAPGREVAYIVKARQTFPPP